MEITDKNETKASAEAPAESGRNGAADDGLGDEIGLLRPGDEGYEEELADIRKKIQTSIEQLERGESYTAEEVFADVRERIRQIEQQAE